MAIAFASMNMVMRAGSPGEFNQWKPPNVPRKHLMPQSSPPGLGSFNPPYFGYGSPPLKRSIECSDSDKASMVEGLKQQIGSWQHRANSVWELQQLGMTSEELYQATLVSPHMQTIMLVAAKVFESIDSPAAFEDEAKMARLYELRTLSVKQRKAAAEFVSENNLDTREAEVLARAIKTHERRAELREGFTAVPGDCLALMHYRAAMESPQQDEKRKLAQRAMQVAVSEVAKAKISKLLDS